MGGLWSPGRDSTWMLAVAILALGVSVLIGRYDGHAVQFVAGFFLGVSLGVSLGISLLCLLGASRRQPIS